MMECKQTLIQTSTCERWKLQFLLQVAATLLSLLESVKGFFFCASAARCTRSAGCPPPPP